MAGVPKSRRCHRCKRNKIKCDEKWPICTACKKADVVCSGPSNLTKFIYNGRHTSPPDKWDANEHKERCHGTETPSGNLERIRHEDLPGGASFSQFRVLASEPRKTLTTVADRVAARLVGYLTHENAGWDTLASIGYVKHLPIRLSESAALRDSVALMCATWANSRRNKVDTNQFLDDILYGKALRSLQRALGDEKQQLRSETLAATTILERLEVIFDNRRPHFRTFHLFGIQELMLNRGPPDPRDDLDIQLALENYASLALRWLVEGGENFYWSPLWKNAIEQAWPMLEKSVPSGRLERYKMNSYYGYWLVFVHKFRRITRNSDSNSQRLQATALKAQITKIQEELKAIGEPILQRDREQGRIIELPHPETPVGTRFHFGSLDSMSYVLSYGMISTIFNRILYQLTGILGQHEAHLMAEYRALCRQMWMCIPFIKQLGITPSILATLPMHISYEGGNREEKEYLMDIITDVARFKGRYPADRSAVERIVIKVAESMTGRRAVTAGINSPQKKDGEGQGRYSEVV
ncbi:hypothetical protein M426DRAFT_238779 [Hypoxylon sp. CI-4A]|nr:hypothetical protein M426DRAFT_238779 [Hypoxylon sp. CI-4A]